MPLWGLSTIMADGDLRRLSSESHEEVLIDPTQPFTVTEDDQVYCNHCRAFMDEGNYWFTCSTCGLFAGQCTPCSFTNGELQDPVYTSNVVAWGMPSKYVNETTDAIPYTGTPVEILLNFGSPEWSNYRWFQPRHRYYHVEDTTVWVTHCLRCMNHALHCCD